MLEVMNIPKSGYIVDTLREKLSPLNPKYYTEVMMNLMDNQDRYAKPIEKVSTAIQKSLDRYIHPKTIEELIGLFKRSYKGRVVSDDCGAFYKGVKIAVSSDGEHLINLYSGHKMSEADTIEVCDWFLKNPDKIGIDNGYKFEQPISALGLNYGDNPYLLENKTDDTRANSEVMQLAKNIVKRG